MLRKLTSRAFGEPSDTTVLSPVILCIGTDRLIGDSLGPLTGSLLQRAHCPLPVYGTLAQPVHALNLADFLAEIRRMHPNRPVIAIDASLGPDSRIGCLTLRPHGLQPGAGVHKRLAPAGDISITGITGPKQPSALPFPADRKAGNGNGDGGGNLCVYFAGGEERMRKIDIAPVQLQKR